MTTQVRLSRAERVEACSLEADMAFFEARLSLAGKHPDTLYQVAQIKTYKTLGMLLADRLQALRHEVDAGSTTRQSPAS